MNENNTKLKENSTTKRQEQIQELKRIADITGKIIQDRNKRNLLYGDEDYLEVKNKKTR